MKRVALLFCVLMLVAPFLFSDGIEPWKAAYGDWKMVSNRLVQENTKAGMAMAYMKLPQTGVVQYEFIVRYVGGIEDEYGGFGVHVGIDKPHTKKSWGNGKSFLLWLTYDPDAYGGWGAYAQAYKSFKHSSMDMLCDGDAYAIPGEYLENVYVSKLHTYYLPVKIIVDYSTGWCKVYDPLKANYYYKFTVGEAVKNGLYLALRTNSVALSFSDLKITKL